VDDFTPIDLMAKFLASTNSGSLKIKQGGE
jgi:hypothetical protein